MSIEDLIWSQDDDDRYQALNMTGGKSDASLTVEQLEALSLDPVSDISEEATRRLKEGRARYPYKVYIQSLADSLVSLEDGDIVCLNLGIRLYHGDWPFEIHMPLQERVDPGTFAMGFARPLHYDHITLPVDYIVSMHHPQISFFGEMEILDRFDLNQGEKNG
jgi:hypothetical protein